MRASTTSLTSTALPTLDQIVPKQTTDFQLSDESGGRSGTFKFTTARLIFGARYTKKTRRPQAGQAAPAGIIDAIPFNLVNQSLDAARQQEKSASNGMPHRIRWCT
jgi:hypothetical protein